MVGKVMIKVGTIGKDVARLHAKRRPVQNKNVGVRCTGTEEFLNVSGGEPGDVLVARPRIGHHGGHLVRNGVHGPQPTVRSSVRPDSRTFPFRR